MDDMPDCGLYRTGVSLVGQENEVPANVLISFHNHSDQGTPMVQLPHRNEHNTWAFHDRGWGVKDPGFLRAMISLKPQGFYVVSGNHLHVSAEEIIPENTLVQLGYNRAADSILFIGNRQNNAIVFAETGYRFENPDVQDVLKSVSLSREDPESTDRTLH